MLKKCEIEKFIMMIYSLIQSKLFITMSVPKFWYRYKEKRTKQNTSESMGKKDLELKLKNRKF